MTKDRFWIVSHFNDTGPRHPTYTGLHVDRMTNDLFFVSVDLSVMACHVTFITVEQEHTD